MLFSRKAGGHTASLTFAFIVHEETTQNTASSLKQWEFLK
jgi:hypothetical protein